MSSAVDSFRHPGFFYRGRAEYLAVTVPFVLRGLAAQELVAVAVPAPNLALIEAELGKVAKSVELVDMQEAGRNPGRIMPALQLALANAHPGPLRMIGEPVWAGRSALEQVACAQHEALLNLAFRGRQATILCPYDAARLDQSVLDNAARTHPVLLDVDGLRDSDSYAPADVLAACNRALPVPHRAAMFRFGVTELWAARRLVAYQGARCGLDAERVKDLTLASAELCANSILHGHGQGQLRVWRESDHVVCEVSDEGHITDPLVGRRPASPGQLGGRGLLLVNQVTDLVRVHSDPGGTTVRVYLRVIPP